MLVISFKPLCKLVRIQATLFSDRLLATLFTVSGVVLGLAELSGRFGIGADMHKPRTSTTEIA